MKNKLLLLLCALFVGMSVRAQVDVTDLYIKNATLANLEGWTVVNFNAPQRGRNTVGYATECWAGSPISKTEYSLTQTITLPAGSYTLVSYAFYRQSWNATDDPSKSLAVLKVGETEVPVPTLGSIELGGYPNSQAAGAGAFDSKMYRNTVDFVVMSDNTEMEIGIVGTHDADASWVIAGMFQLFNNDLTPGDDDTADMTHLIFNPGFEGCALRSSGNITGWTHDSDVKFQAQDNNQTLQVGAKFLEKWQSSGILPAGSLSQVVNDLPAGLYTLSANLHGDGAFFSANNGKDTYTARCGTTEGKFEVTFEIKEGDNLTIKTGTAEDINTNWVYIDNFNLKRFLSYKGYAKNILNSITYPIEGLGDKAVKAAYEQAYADFSAFVNNIQPGDETTIDDINNAKATFDAAEAAWKASIDIWSDYSRTAKRAQSVNAQIEAQEYVPNPAKNALNTYANASSSTAGPGYKDPSGTYTFVNGNYAYIIEQANLTEEQLTAEVTFLKGLIGDAASQSSKDGMDVTYMLVNADFSDPSLYYGWTTSKTSGPNWQYRSGLSGWPVNECYANNDNTEFDIYQVVENAPAGLYKVSINAFYRLAGTETKVPVELYMGTIQNPIQNINDDKIQNDLTLDEINHVYIDGEVAKNGTNCYFHDGNTASYGVGKQVWKLNNNENPEIKQRMINSEDWTDAGKEGPDGKVTVEEVEYLIPASMEGASIAFSAGRYPMVVYGEVADEGKGVGTLKIGIKTTTAMKKTGWALWGGFKLELTGTDPVAMKELLGQKLDILEGIFAWGTDEGPNLVLTGVVVEKIATYRALIENPLATYEELKAAYDETVLLIDRANGYADAYSDYTSKAAQLTTMIEEATGDEKKADAVKYAQNVQDVYTNLLSVGFCATTEEDVAELKAFALANPDIGVESIDVTKENLEEAVEGGSDAGLYVSTYAQFNAFYDEISVQLGSIYLEVKGTGTPEAPEELTSQLKNPDFVEDDGVTTDKTQWWGSAWKDINYGSGEMYYSDTPTYDVYQSVFMPAGYYTLVGFTMDRRAGWAEVLSNPDNHKEELATQLYAKVGDADTLSVDACNAKYVAQLQDITNPEEEPAIATTTVGELEYYTPNSMSQYRKWMDARNEENKYQFGTELKFYVPTASFASLGFYLRKKAEWFICDGIKLFYAVDDYPSATGIVAPTSIEKYGKPDGKYLEKGKIVIYSNGKKFNTAGQILK